MKLDQLKAGIILNYVTIALNVLVGILYTPFMLRMMGQNEYGLYSLVASIISYLTILDLGFGNAIIRYTAKLRVENKLREQYEMFGMFLILYLIIGLAAFILGLGLYFNVDFFFETTMSMQELSKARIMIMLLIFNLAITFPLSIFGSVIQAYENFIFMRIVNVFRIILTTVVMIVLLYIGYKAVALVVLQTVLNITILLLNYIYSKKVLRIKILFGKINISFLKEIAIYSFWIFLIVIVDKIYWNTGQFVLGATIGTAAVAIYAVAIQLHVMHEQFSTAMSAIFLPRITTMVSRNKNEKEVSDLFIKTGRIQYLILSYILVAFIVFGRTFITLWVGEDYDDAYMMTLLFFVPSTVPLIQNLGIIIMQARNQMKFRSICYSVIALFSIFLQLIFVHFWGGIGCALAIAISMIMGHILVMNFYYKKKQHLDMVEFWKQIAQMSIVPGIALIFVSFFTAFFPIKESWFDLFLHVVVYTIIYAPFAYFLQMNEYERSLINKALNLVKKIKTCH